MIPTLRHTMPERIRAGDACTITAHTALPTTSVAFLVLTGVLQGAVTRLFIGGNGTGTTVDGVTRYAGASPDETGLVTIALASSDTAAWLRGRYQWIAFAIDAAGNRTELAQGETYIDPNPTATSPADPRTRNQRVLANIRALIEGKSLDDVALYKVGGRELTKIPTPDLLKWEGIYARKCSRRRVNSVPISFGGGR